MKIAQFADLLFLAGSMPDLRAETPKELAAAAAKGDLYAIFELGSRALSKGEYR